MITIAIQVGLSIKPADHCRLVHGFDDVAGDCPPFMISPYSFNKNKPRGVALVPEAKSPDEVQRPAVAWLNVGF
jgi:hypothetical protein